MAANSLQTGVSNSLLWLSNSRVVNWCGLLPGTKDENLFPVHFTTAWVVPSATYIVLLAFLLSQVSSMTLSHCAVTEGWNQASWLVIILWSQVPKAAQLYIISFPLGWLRSSALWASRIPLLSLPTRAFPIFSPKSAIEFEACESWAWSQGRVVYTFSGECLASPSDQASASTTDPSPCLWILGVTLHLESNLYFLILNVVPLPCCL